MFFSALLSFPLSSYLSQHFFPLFLLLSPFISLPHLHSVPPRSLFSPPVISAVQLTASVLWVSALALSFIQPFSSVCVNQSPRFSACISCFHDYLLQSSCLLSLLHFPHPSLSLSISPSLPSCLLVVAIVVNFNIIFHPTLFPPITGLYAHALQSINLQ